MKQYKKDVLNPTHNIHYLLRLFSLKFKKADINFSDLVLFIQKVLEQEKPHEAFLAYNENTEDRLKEELELLAIENRCSLKYREGAVQVIHFPGFYLDSIRKAFKDAEYAMEKSFPSEESLQLYIPVNILRVVKVKEGFIQLLEEKKEDHPVLIRLVFPDIINSIIITSDLIRDKLLDFAIYKIKHYLDKKRNASYMENKIFPIFRQKSVVIREMINNIVVKPGQAINTIKDPSDFSFRFWAHFANLIIQEYKQKNELLASEHDYCQAAYLVGFFNIYYKGVQQKAKEKQLALSQFELHIKKAPYIYSLVDLYEFKDRNGYYLLKKYSREFLNQTIEDKIRVKKGDNLPELIRILTPTGREFYIHKSGIIPFCLKKLYEASRELRRWYINKWIDLLKHNSKSEIMFHDDIFLEDLQEKLQLSYPVLSVLFNYNFLFLANQENQNEKTKPHVTRLLDMDKRSLRPLTEILELSRQDLLDEARTYLPFWETIPLLRSIIKALKRLFVGKSRDSVKHREKVKKRLKARYGDSMPVGEVSGSNRNRPEPERVDEISTTEVKRGKTLVPKLRSDYKKALRKLKSHFVGENDSIDSKLEFLAEKWNPLYDPGAKKNLVTDVNSIVRDFLRSLRRGFRVKPPDIDRVKNLAKTLVKNKSFDEIKKRDYLTQYIEIYMIKLLGDNRF